MKVIFEKDDLEFLRGKSISLIGYTEQAYDDMFVWFVKDAIETALSKIEES